MELKIKYQYTYFIKPFLINESKYEKYILNLLKNKHCKLKTFEKERDLNLYSFFLKNIRDYFFPTFSYNRDKINKLKKLDLKTRAIVLSKMHCNVFEYTFDKQIQGKINEKEGIFFNINKIEIICFDTGICFFCIKTDMNSNDKFSDLLNFNYRFKDINSDYDKLKDFTNIKIQTDKFGSMKELSDFIDDIIGVNNNITELKDIDLYNKRFFVYSYSCIDQDCWNSENDFDTFENEFLKYNNLLPSSNTSRQNKEELDKNARIIDQIKYSRFGFTKQSGTLMTSSVDFNNYTKLLYSYENEYFYTLIISLYQRIYLKKLDNRFVKKKNLKRIRNKFVKFSRELWSNEITNSAVGTIIYNKWKEIFELEEIYNEIKNKYDTIYKDLNIEKNNRTNKVILIALIISLILNVINFIAITKLI